MEEALEIIEFVRPEETSKKLFIPNLCESPIEQKCVQEQLQEVFTQYGLLHDVAVIPADDSRDVTSLPAVGDDVYAFVTFYSYHDAMNAKRSETGKLVINGRLANIKFSRRRNHFGAPGSLYVAKCYELANHFLGYNGWTSKILSIKPVVEEVEPGHSCSVSVNCVVQITLTAGGLHSEGAASSPRQGYAKVGLSTKGVAMCKAKKQAYQLAMQDAFRKVLLVRLPDGRCHAEVNTTAEDHILLNEELDKSSLLKVNECIAPPLVDSDDDVMEDLDEMNMQILMDLENSCFENSE